MQTKCIRDFLSILDTLQKQGRSIGIKHEHKAISIYSSLEVDLAHYRNLGFSIMMLGPDSAQPETAWIQWNDLRLRLIPKNQREYEAWATSTARGFLWLYEFLCEPNEFFEKVGELSDTYRVA